MPQETNLNITPYNDDYSPVDSYYKILFKPNPIQARELNSLQSILQNQIEQFGNHLFKEGSVVIPGNIDYDGNLNAVELQNSYNGVNISSYLPLLQGKTLIGKNSGVRATVVLFITESESVRGNNTIYVKYISASLDNGTTSVFADGEELVLEQSSTASLSDGQSFVFTEGQSIVSTIANNCNSIASSVSVTDGVYFIRGTFVNVFNQVLILDQYSNNVSYKIGFFVNEKIVTAYDKPQLFDNASGFSNYTAPGADRFLIDLSLAKYELDEKPSNFVQLLEIKNGTLISSQNIPEYNILAKELARRTYKESGDYYVTNPTISINESYNNHLGNNGIYEANDVTYNGNTPSESLGIYKVSPFQAFVQGYEIKTGTSFVDFQKPRTTKLLERQEVNYYTGSTMTLNRVYGSPIIGISTNYTVSLRDTRVGTNQNVASGKEIGLARVYDFALESGSYNVNNLNTNEWDISLFDSQPYVEIFVNQNLDSDILYNIPCQVEGKSSGASGFLRYDSRNVGILTVYDVRGNFAVGERLVFNGIENTRVSTAVTSYSLDDVKSVYGVVGTGFTFTADTKQSLYRNYGQVNITAVDPLTGISTVTTTNDSFLEYSKSGNIVAFTNPGNFIVNYAKIIAVSPFNLKIVGVTTVPGLCEGALPNSSINPVDFRILSTSFSRSQDNTLYTQLPKKSVSNVNLNSSNIIIRKQFDVTISSNSVGPINAEVNETFLSFDEERYALIREDGSTEILSQDKFSFTNGSSTLTINGLGNNGNAKLIATLRKVNVKEKVKYKNRIQTLIVDKSKYSGSGIGTNTRNDGLTYGNYPYGTRVQDREICLLTPDVTKLYGVFESSTITEANLPRVTLSLLSGPTNKTNDLLIGEKLVGETSNAVAVYVKRITDLTISVVYLSAFTFNKDERVTFQETGITANVFNKEFGDRNITSQFIFDAGQKNTIYDYSKITRIPSYNEPTRPLLIVYESAEFQTSDTGDLITVNSYNNFDYCDIPKINSTTTSSDIIDVRPRVSKYSVVENTRSPFEFLGRTFTELYSNPKNILASDESINLDYSFYLPRIDKLFLSQNGRVELASGAPSEVPQPPNNIENSLEIATIYLPPYLCNVADVELRLQTHKRYRMEDIKKLEDRISNLEYYTSLSLLETDTSKLFIPDNNGLNRFKSGFFVDNFINTDTQQKTTLVKNSIDIVNKELRPTHYTTQIDLILASNGIVGITTTANTQVDLRFANDIIGSNIKKTGELITLDYDMVAEIVQPFSTRVENVASYRSSIYGGTLSLYPSSDVWADQVKLSTNNVYSKTYTPSDSQQTLARTNPQNGMNPVFWDYVSQIWSQGNTFLSAQIANYLRSRNIEFTGKCLKPNTKIYTFFDDRPMSRFVIPKLLQITMIQGTFQVGETVFGSSSTGWVIKFRVAKSNHKFGPYNNPTTTYQENPYFVYQNVPETYSSTTTLLNIDTYSLANNAQTVYGGAIHSGMFLKGQTSGAEATINADISLVTDNNGDIIGSVFIPNGNEADYPSFEAGTRRMRITDSPTNSLITGGSTTYSEANFISTGSLIYYQENVVVAPPPPPPAPTPAPTPAPAPAPTPEPAPATTPAPPSRPAFRNGVIDIRGGGVETTAEGHRLRDSINSLNNTSYSMDKLLDAADIKKASSYSDLNKINKNAKRMYDRGEYS